MSGFSRPTDRHIVGVRNALREGGHRNRDANIEVLFNGTCEAITAFDGALHLATGRMDFYHHGSNVLALDFDNDRVTDFGYDGYSNTTNTNIFGWMWALRTCKFIGIQSLDPCLYPTHWTWVTRRSRRYGKPMHPMSKASDRVRWTYATTAPWVRWDLGWPWFHARLYDAHAVRRSRAVMDTILDRGQWHWFTGEWINGEWTRRFIDAETEKRYNRRRSRT